LGCSKAQYLARPWSAPGVPELRNGVSFKTVWFNKAAKKDRANIDPDELAAFKRLAQAYGRMTPMSSCHLHWVRVTYRSYFMTNKVKFKSDALEAIYSAAQGLHRAGTIDTSVDQYAATLGK